MQRRTSNLVTVWVGAAVLLLLLIMTAGYGVRSWQSLKRRPIVAVLRFDNETSDPGMSSFSDGLTDDVVEALTSSSRGRYDVIGNARILRLPRDQRDLSAISSSLHAKYIVLGQVQGGGAQTRILAHLIRLPAQTHLWVARMDQSPLDLLSSDLLGLESAAAQKIAAEFSSRVVADSSGSPLPPAPSQ